MALGKEAEGSPLVADIGQAEQAVDHWDRVVERDRAIDNNLGCLVQEDNKKKQARDEFALRGQDGTKDLRTREQRGQTVG